MTRNKLSDKPAIQTLSGAEFVLKQLYEIDKMVRVYEGQRDEAKERADQSFETLTAALTSNRDLLAAGLEDFAHREMTGKSKSHACPWGKFGLRRQTKVVVDDIKKCLQTLLRREHFDCIKTTQSPDRRAMARFDDKALPQLHAHREQGDVFFWDTGASQKGGGK